MLGGRGSRADRPAEDDVDGQQHEQDAAAHPHAGQADADDSEEVVAEEREQDQEGGGYEDGPHGHAPLLFPRDPLGEHRINRRHLDRTHSDEQRGERREDELDHEAISPSEKPG